MSTINITRHDRGLDSKRIEKIISMMGTRISDIKYDRKDILKDKRKILKKEVIAQYELEPHYAAIQGIDDQIEKLEKQIKNLKNEKEPHQIAIAKVMRGSENTYDYERVQEGSPADQYMKERLPDIDKIKEELAQLEETIAEKLWLAKDIEEARDLYNFAISEIEKHSQSL